MSADVYMPGEADFAFTHTYSPTFYFRSWEGEDENLCETINVNGTLAQFRKPPEEAHFDYALYADTREFNARQHETIRAEFFDILDRTGPEMLAGLLGSRPLNVGQTLLCARFLASMHIRVDAPAIRRKRRGARQRNTGTVRSKVTSAGPAPFVDTVRTQGSALMTGSNDDANARWRRVEKSRVPDKVIGSAADDLAFENKTVRQILSMDWHALDISTSPHRFFTSDRPGVFTRDIDDPRCVITLPLSPQRALFALNPTSSEDELLGITAAGKLATALNLSTFAKAVGSVYSRDADDASEAFLRRHVPFSKAG